MIRVLSAGGDVRVVAEADGPSVAGSVLGDHEVFDQNPRVRVDGNVLRAAAVVREEEDERVVELAGFFERRQDAADALVHAVDLRRINLHAAQQPVAALGLAPGRLSRVAIRQAPGRLNDSAWDEAGEPLLPELVPTGIEAAFVL